MLRDRSRRLLWLSQEAYIEKIAKQYGIDLDGRLPDTPMAESELLPTYPRSVRPTIAADGGLRIRYQHSRSTIIGRSTVDLWCLNWTPQNYGKLSSTSSTSPRLFSSLRKQSTDTSPGWARLQTWIRFTQSTMDLPCLS